MDTWNLDSLRLAVAGLSQHSSDTDGMQVVPRERDIQCLEDLLATTALNSPEEGELNGATLEAPQQQLKSFKVEFVPLQSGPYSDIQISLLKTLQHGSNTYSTLSTVDQDITYEALEQRCHSFSQLKKHRFVFLGDASSSGIKMPAGITFQDFLPSQPPSGRAPKRRAVAIDCEMVGIEAPIGNHNQHQNLVGPGFEGTSHVNHSPPLLHQPIRPRNNRISNRGLRNLTPRRVETSEIAYLCVVDVLTGEILIDQFVQPQGKVVNWRTRYSGITFRAFREAKSRGNCLPSWRAARAKLWEYIDADTILIGHCLENDLQILRLAHTRIIDTSLQTAEAVFSGVESFRRIWGLKDLAKELMGIHIQNHGRQGHDCVEDTLATRELALWCLRNPQRLKA